MPAKKIRVLLLFPPRWDALAPYPAVPQLMAYLRSRGILVKGDDLNAQLLHWMLSARGSRRLAASLQTLVDAAQDFAEDPKLAHFAAWARLWMNEIPRDHRQLRNRLSAPAQWTIRDMHAFQVIIQRAWAMLEILDAAHRLCPEMPVPHRLFLKDRLQKLLKWKPDIVGFSCVTQHQLLFSLDCARTLKNLGCQAGFVAGGSAVSSAFGTRYSQSSLPGEMDCLVVGPGEEALVQLVDLMKQKTQWPRILHGREQGHEIAYARDFHTPDRGNRFWSRYSFPYPLSDGCRWRKCKFCGLYCTRRYKVSDPESLIDQLKELKKTLGCVSFFNTGAELAANDAAKIAGALQKKKLSIRWQSMARADGDWTEPLCRQVKKQGFEYVMFGIESLSDPILTLMGKGMTAGEQIKALAAACKSGLKPAVSLIFDFPGEQIRDLETTLEAIAPYVDDLSSLTLLRFHLDRTSIMVAHEQTYGLKTKNKILRSLYRDDIFQIRHQDLRRDRRHLTQALQLFDQWIYSLHQKRSMLFIRDTQSVQLGFDLNFFFEGCHAAKEGLSHYFTREAILKRRYVLNQKLMGSIPGKGKEAGFYHKYLMQGIGAGTLQAKVLQELGRGLSVNEALANVRVSPEKNMSDYLSLMQMINGLDLLSVLLPGHAHSKQPHRL